MWPLLCSTYPLTNENSLLLWRAVNSVELWASIRATPGRKCSTAIKTMSHTICHYTSSSFCFLKKQKQNNAMSQVLQPFIHTLDSEICKHIDFRTLALFWTVLTQSFKTKGHVKDHLSSPKQKFLIVSWGHAARGIQTQMWPYKINNLNASTMRYFVCTKSPVLTEN